MTLNHRSVALAAVLAVLLPSGAFADRPPTDEERAEIEAALEAEGFTEWREIEFDEDDDDDEVWEIDDAVAADGQKYDLKLDADLNIVDRDRED